MQTLDPLVVVESVTKGYRTPDGGQHPVLNGVSLQLNAGESMALTGDSGSGKSTLLHLIGALDDVDTGSIRVDGTPLAGLDDRAKAKLRRDHIGLVFQQFNLIPALTVAQNIALQARLSGRLDDGWITTLTERLGLSALTQRYPEDLSGGQQQRVAIGRALAARPALILADEPTGNLDEVTSDSVLDVMLELVRETGAGLLLVTHSTALASRLDRRLHLSQGQLT